MSKNGIVKKGSIEMKRGTLENRFVVTDFKHDITVLYKGKTRGEYWSDPCL